MTVKDNILKMYSDDIQISDIMEKLKCTASYIYRVIREKDKCTPNTIKNNECINLLSTTDMTFFMISRHLSVSESFVIKLAYDNDLRQKKKAIW